MLPTSQRCGRLRLIKRSAEQVWMKRVTIGTKTYANDLAAAKAHRFRAASSTLTNRHAEILNEGDHHGATGNPDLLS